MAKIDGRKSEACRRKHKEDATIHGMSDTRLYGIWCNMKGRCYNESNPAYKNYGGRGIEICEEWKFNFSNFYDWSIQHGYSEDLTIERINVDLGYCPENCCWADRVVQNNNTRRNRYLTFKGETKTMSEWANDLNISYYVIRRRLYDGWSVQDALTKPVAKPLSFGLKFTKGRYTYLIYKDAVLSQKELLSYIGVSVDTFGHYLSECKNVEKAIEYYCNKNGKSKEEAVTVSKVENN